MADDKRVMRKPHSMIIEDRKNISLSGVNDVGSFDEQSVVVITDFGELSVRGKGLHINKLSLETGELTIDGEITALIYSDTQPTSSGLFSKLFR
ncbi:MAG: sporulation protein YabP [Bacillota bacterium]|nr:sporulation protein YabP [Bacillota bacterium]